MSKFFRALEEADPTGRGERDGRTAVMPAPSAVSGQPRAGETRPPQRRADTALDEHLVSLLTPTTFEADQYRILRHLVEERRKERGMTIVAVSSPSVGDGKTTTALNLAGSLAQDAGARVLVIDADLRHSAIPDRLGVAARTHPGLVEAIVEPHRRLAELVQCLAPFNLSLLTAGRVNGRPYEILRSARLAGLFEELRSEYDYIVVDTPPMVPFPDCRLIEALVDGVFIVVAAHKTKRRSIEEALNIVGPDKLLAIVLNNDDRSRRKDIDRIYGADDGARRWRWWGRDRRRVTSKAL